VVLLGGEFWRPLLEQLGKTLLGHNTVDTKDMELLHLFDSPEKAVDHIRERALMRFGLTEGPRLRRRWFLGER
jgi:predicted Rossmann-fold nucleotide-binding protein